jgi:hypothetical protein
MQGFCGFRWRPGAGLRDFGARARHWVRLLACPPQIGIAPVVGFFFFLFFLYFLYIDGGAFPAPPIGREKHHL